MNFVKMINGQEVSVYVKDKGDLERVTKRLEIQLKPKAPKTPTRRNKKSPVRLYEESNQSVYYG